LFDGRKKIMSWFWCWFWGRLDWWGWDE